MCTWQCLHTWPPTPNDLLDFKLFLPMLQTGSFTKLKVVPCSQVMELSPESVCPVLHPTDTAVP